MKIEELLEISIREGASDLHILPENVPLLRVHGTLAPIKDFPSLSPAETKELIYSAMTKEEQEEFEKNRVFEKAIFFPHIGNFRASILHQLRGVAAVLRIVPEKIPTFEELGLPPILKTLLNLPHGLILVAGATGSGKSSTLAAMINYINEFRACNIITIEDPIEYIHENNKSVFHQLQVGRDTTDFASALRSSLRQDPDVILIGELRDLETMRLSLTAAETGHLVLATIHASSAPIAVSRFADVFPSEEKNRVRNLLSEALQGIICQTLVKKISGGRVAAFEIMLMTPSIRHYIKNDMPAHIESAMQTSNEKGMCTLEQYLQQLVSRRIINPMVAESAIIGRTFKEAVSTKKKR